MSKASPRTTRQIRPLRGEFVWLASLLLLATLQSGCGYALAGRGSFLPAYIRIIGIPTFTNRTTIFNLETMLTDKEIGRASCRERV